MVNLGMVVPALQKFAMFEDTTPTPAALHRTSCAARWKALRISGGWSRLKRILAMGSNPPGE